MAKQRIVNTRFWDDTYIAGLKPEQKLLFLYFLTNPLTNIAGVYEISTNRIEFDTGISTGTVNRSMELFARDGKMIYQSGWIGINNFIKYQTLNPKVKRGILHELDKAPQEILDKLSIDYQSLSDSNSNINTNTNINPALSTSREIIGL